MRHKFVPAIFEDKRLLLLLLCLQTLSMKVENGPRGQHLGPGLRQD